jgi:phosphatidylglycerophosphate synthase
MYTVHSMKEISGSIPPEKKWQDGLWTRFVLRPLSIPVTWFALRLRLQANTVSYLSVVFSIAGGVLFALPGFWRPLWGAILLNVFSVFDCVDGNIARVTKTAGPWGGWADAVMGFVAYTAVFFATGVYIFLRMGWWQVLLITGITSSANLLTRVAYQIYKNIEGEKAHESVSFERKLAENVGVTGFMMPALVLCHVTGRGMMWIIAFNCLFYLGGCVVTIIKTAKKAHNRTAASGM